MDPLESGVGGRKKRVSATEPGQVLDAAGLRKASLRARAFLGGPEVRTDSLTLLCPSWS